ncbi:hypothetical protein RRF57_009448 [Xylaria bambusicola]|uniref:Uncharacterized protein n=1 Tax=Xylaria bambusicola TaxID=326684 RepID=A0AAN7UZF5_9PEZI
MDKVLSDGTEGLVALSLRAAGGTGGARPLPLPKTRPPPSLRPDMAAEGGAYSTGEQNKAIWLARRRSRQNDASLETDRTLRE